MKAQEFLARHAVETVEQVDAKKATITGPHVLSVTTGVDRVVAVKGKKIVEIDLKRARPSDDELRSVLLGPTGNLRAPTLRVGRTLLVGFDAETYQKTLK